MMLHEINAQLDNPITQEQLDAVHPLYCVLNFSKSAFAAIVELIGIEELASLKERWERLSAADIEYTAGERYLKNLKRREELDEQLSLVDAELGRYELSRQGKGFLLYARARMKGGANAL